MTEEIIVNGVDVSGCRFLDEYKHCGICKELCEGHCLILQDIECKTYEDCYYKQLKRLETENAKLKNKYNENITVNTQLQEWQDEDLRQIAELKNDLDLFRKAHDNEQAQRRIFEQKLEKIKEKINAHCAVCETMKRPKCDDCILSWLLEIIEGAKDEL